MNPILILYKIVMLSGLAYVLYYAWTEIDRGWIATPIAIVGSLIGIYIAIKQSRKEAGGK